MEPFGISCTLAWTETDKSKTGTRHYSRVSYCRWLYKAVTDSNPLRNYSSKGVKLFRNFTKLNAR